LEDTSETPLTVVTDVTEVVKAAMPCVVSITNNYTSYNSWYGEAVDEEACGSGIIVQQSEEELLIVTNYHVIEDNNTITVTFYDDSDAEAYVKGVSADDDLAIVSVSLEDLGDDTIDSIAIAVLGDSDTLQVGEPAIAIGNSLGYGQSVTTGVISAINRNINDSYLIQTDAAINPGNSGGALLNIRGEVIGINSSKIADYVIEGMGYAIPISTAKPIINELMLNETKKKVASDNRGFLGISGTDVTEDASSRYGMPSGVYVVDVIDDSGAQKAGIEKGDIIVSLDGEKVTSMTGLQGMLEYYEAGTKVTVVLERQNNGDYREHSVTVTLGKRSQE
jgi:serine protease Do